MKNQLRPSSEREAEILEIMKTSGVSVKVAKAVYNLAVKHVVDEYLYHTDEVITCSGMSRKLNDLKLDEHILVDNAL